MTSRLIALLLCCAPLSLSAQDSVFSAVEAALQRGAYWQATEMLQPLLASGTSDPRATIAAARAAAGWEGWSTVERLLRPATWLADRFDALGYRLLADAALADDRPSDALRYSRAALPRTLFPRDAEEEAHRWINLARAHERLGAWDSAAAGYTHAAALIPDISDWLALRAAGVTLDSTARARLYSTVTLPSARARVVWTEALAWTRADEKGRAAREYAVAGDKATALRLRWEARSGDDRSTIATALVALIRGGTAAEARQAIAVIDDYRVPISRADSLAVARRAAAIGVSRSAIELFSALARGGTLARGDRFSLADARASRGDWAGAERDYARITAGPEAGMAAYQRARAQLRQGQVSRAKSSLAAVVRRYPGDTAAAGIALYLLSDLALDAGEPDSARALLRRLSARYPGNAYAARAALIAPLIALARRQPERAAAELGQAIATGQLTGFDADAGRYWMGRAELARGDTAAARVAFRYLLDRGVENYYALKAAARLDTMPWRLPPPVASAEVALPDAIRRSTLLDALGLGFEADLERRGAMDQATSREELIGAARGLIATGHPSLAPLLAARIVRAGGTEDGAVWRLRYVLPYRDQLDRRARAAGLDPWLVAGVIRQESAFDPHARSAADARGLMQLLPGSGRDIARARGVRNFDPAMLWQPEVNIDFGVEHLARELHRYPELERSLAAYNAGPGRAASWSRTLLTGNAADSAGLPDPELFVERIPYIETRNYIRRITVNRVIYQLLYASESPS